MVVFFVSKNKYVLSASLFVGIIGLLSKKTAFYIAFLWLKIGDFLGKISSTIILSFIYFFVLMPIALIMKITKPKSAFTAQKKESYYLIRNHHFSAKDLENTW